MNNDKNPAIDSILKVAQERINRIAKSIPHDTLSEFSIIVMAAAFLVKAQDSQDAGRQSMYAVLAPMIRAAVDESDDTMSDTLPNLPMGKLGHA